MTLFERMAAGEFSKTKPVAVAKVANPANQGRKLAKLARLATANTQEMKPLTTAQQIELRRLVSIACEPHERDEMLTYALSFGIASLTTYRGIVADIQNTTEITGKTGLPETSQ